MRPITVAALFLAAAAGGCKKKPPASAAAAAPAPPAAEKVDDRNTTFRSDGTVLGNAYRAGKRTVQMHDMSQLGVLITAMELETNRMPTAEAITAAMKTDAKNIHKLIADGTIVLTGTTKKDGMWAYEIDADKAGGVVLVAGRASRASADEVKEYLAQK